MYIDWHSEKTKRVYTSIIFVAILAAAFGLRFLTVWIFDVFIIAFAMLAVYEVAKAKQLESRGVSVYYLLSYIVMAYTMFVIGIATGFSWWLHLVMQGTTIFIFTFYTMIMNYMDRDFAKEVTLKKGSLTESSARTGWEFLKVVFYPFFFLFTLVFLNHLGSSAYVLPFAGAVDTVPALQVSLLGLLLVFMVSCFSDTFAYITGRILKGPKLCPKISPGKTISGFVGALFGGVIGALLTLLIVVRDGSLLQVFLTEQIGDSAAVQLTFAFLGFFGAMLTHAGDIYASWLKRRCNIKDFGKILPGHGGVMDRFDGISWNAVFVFLVFLIFVFM